MRSNSAVDYKRSFMPDISPLLGFVSRSFLLHLPLADHHVEHLQPGVEPLARLAAGEDDAPLVVPAQLPQGERAHHLPLVEGHRQVLLVGHDEQWGVRLLVLEGESSV